MLRWNKIVKRHIHTYDFNHSNVGNFFFISDFYPIKIVDDSRTIFLICEKFPKKIKYFKLEIVIGCGSEIFVICLKRVTVKLKATIKDNFGVFSICSVFYQEFYFQSIASQNWKKTNCFVCIQWKCFEMIYAEI